MIRNFLMVLFACSCLFSACAQSKKTTKSGDPAPQGSNTKSGGLRGLSAVSMRRGACFGRCPEYTITVHSDGLAQYASIRNAEPIGNFQKNIGTKKAQDLLREFMDHHADTCRELYEAKIADLPGLTYTLTINGKEKMIHNANFGPTYLMDLSNEIDQLGPIDTSWKKFVPKKD